MSNSLIKLIGSKSENDVLTKMDTIMDPEKIGYVENSVTPLIIACKKEYAEVAMKLIRTGQSNPAQVDNDGNTALLYCLDSSIRMRDEVAVMLLDYHLYDCNIEQVNKFGQNALILACMSGNNKLVSYLLNADVGIGQVDNRGNTALMHACGNHNIDEDTIILLINSGKINLDQVNQKGETATYIATNNKLQKVVNALQYTYRKPLLRFTEGTKMTNHYPVKSLYGKNVQGVFGNEDFLRNISEYLGPKKGGKRINKSKKNRKSCFNL
jgi:hypothetical protein